MLVIQTSNLRLENSVAVDNTTTCIRRIAALSYGIYTRCICYNISRDENFSRAENINEMVIILTDIYHQIKYTS